MPILLLIVIETKETYFKYKMYSNYRLLNLLWNNSIYFLYETMINLNLNLKVLNYKNQQLFSKCGL